MNTPFLPDYAVPPGETVAEAIEAAGLSIESVCQDSPITPEELSAAIEVRTPFDQRMIDVLQERVGLPAALLIRLQDNFLNDCARLSGRTSLEILADFQRSTRAGESVNNNDLASARSYLAELWRKKQLEK